jgi:hypothetical protein
MGVSHEETRAGAGIDRRGFLTKIGIGAAGAVAVGAGCPMGQGATARAAGGTSVVATDRFGRLFPTLGTFAPESPAVTAALTEMGKRGGLLDANDDLSKGPVALITEPGLSAGNPNNPTHTAGTTFVGQFLDHDITFDTSSALGHATSATDTVNHRSARFDLDSVYGAGPEASAFLYRSDDRDKLKVESGGLYEDLPRDGENTAIIGDPRNDENLIVGGLHASMLMFHNAAVDKARSEGSSAVFEDARRMTRWHYQWLILHQFLPQFVGQDLVDDILKRGRRVYRPKDFAYIPVEFQGACYRFGHSMVRPSYRANMTGNPGGKPFFAMVFDASESGKRDPDDLSGGVRARRRFVGWETFFDFADGNVKPNKMIDSNISSPLFDLPLPTLPGRAGPSSLAQRNLLRHLTWELPSGQDVAAAIGSDRLAAADLDELSGLGVGFERSTPLWYYTLKEAELMAGGRHLGPVGGRIVAEVFIGLLQLDPGSYLTAEPKWTPTAGSAGRDFEMTDFLTFAGVDPASRRAR